MASACGCVDQREISPGGITDNTRLLNSVVYEPVNRYLVFINSFQQTMSDYPRHTASYWTHVMVWS
jgi:hypothetical protein